MSAVACGSAISFGGIGGLFLVLTLAVAVRLLSKRVEK